MRKLADERHAPDVKRWEAWAEDGNKFKRMEAKQQLKYMLARLVKKVGAEKTLGRIMGAYSAWANTGLSWEFIHRPDAEPLYFSQFVLERFFPKGYGHKQKRAVTYMGQELKRIAEAVDKDSETLVLKYLKGTEFESLQQFHQRYAQWMADGDAAMNAGAVSRGKFPKVKRTAEGEASLKRLVRRHDLVWKLGEMLGN